MSRDRNAGFIADLWGPRREVAWSRFLDEHSQLLMRIALQHAHFTDLAEDCFLHLCERFCEDDARRLRQYDPARGVAFEGWLQAVAHNLARDWRRSEFDRMRIPTAIRSLEEVDRRVYSLRFEQSLSADICLGLLQADWPGYTREALAESLARIHQALSPRQRWRRAALAGAQDQRMVPFDKELPATAVDEDPVRAAEVEERSKQLQQALKRLEPEQRLALRLRYEQHLSLEDVAVVLGLDNLHQARRRVETALKRLRDQMSSS